MILKKVFCIFFPFIILLGASSGWSVSECKQILVETKVTHTSTETIHGSVDFDFKEASNQFIVYLLHPKGVLELLKDNKADSLPKGKYDFIITGKEDDTPYCPKHLNIIIN